MLEDPTEVCALLGQPKGAPLTHPHAVPVAAAPEHVASVPVSGLIHHEHRALEPAERLPDGELTVDTDLTAAAGDGEIDGHEPGADGGVEHDPIPGTDAVGRQATARGPDAPGEPGAGPELVPPEFALGRDGYAEGIGSRELLESLNADLGTDIATDA